MIAVSDKESGASIGSITDSQLQILVDHLPVCMPGCMASGDDPAARDTAAPGGGASATQKTAASQPAGARAEPFVEADHIKVQHILIGYQGSVRGKTITRSKEEARVLAYEILAMTKKDGADFGALVKKYTNDAFPGIYGMSNRGVPKNPGERRREDMVPAFGNAGFPLRVGEVGIADYDPRASPYGWHIVKRIE